MYILLNYKSEKMDISVEATLAKEATKAKLKVNRINVSNFKQVPGTKKGVK